MGILIVCDEEQESEIVSGINEKDNITFTRTLPEKNEFKNYDAFFILSKTHISFDFASFENKPVFINQVIRPLSELGYPNNVSRINGWPGFLKRKTWEVVSNDKEKTRQIFDQIGRKTLQVQDEPGFVSARVISMIINEAFFAFGEKISSKEEIDMAMKLGTNYPYGPFEWTNKIGIENIYHLLKILAKKEERYLPSGELEKEFLGKEKQQ